MSPTQPVCRNSQIEQLGLYLGYDTDTGHVVDTHLSPELILVSGVEATGKTVTLKWLLSKMSDNSDVKHAFVDCIESYQPKLLFQSILSQLGGDCDKCDNVSDFLVRLVSCVGDSRTVVVLEHAERLRDDLSLLSVMTRLQEISECNVTTIMETRLDWSKITPAQDVIAPVIVHFTQYNRDELTRLVAAFLQTEISLASDEDNMFRLQYAGLVLSLFYNITRSLTELVHIARQNFLVYQQPIILGECQHKETKKLWTNIEPHLKKCLTTVHLREVASGHVTSQEPDDTLSMLSVGPSISNANRLSIELPFYSKFLLIAAFLASYNPAKSDKRFFVKHHGKQKKTAMSIKAKEKLNSQLTGPKPFPLERLLAIFYNIVEEQVNPSATIYSQVTSLVRLQLLSSVGMELVDQPKFKCNVSMDFIRIVSKSVQFDIYKYLYDFN